MLLTFDPRQTVRWAYLLLLGREPESELVIDLHLQGEGNISLEAIRRRFLLSDEFIALLREIGLDVTDKIRSIGPLEGLLGVAPSGVSGFFTDRFGVRTRLDYLPPVYQEFSGLVGSADGRFDMPVHDTEELKALLRSVAEADGQFAIMELGAGWGPWLVLGGHLARRRGLPVTMMGVEGSSGHVAFMTKHLEDNGFDPTSHHVIHAVAGESDGVAYFPKLPEPRDVWGAVASYDVNLAGGVPMEKVASMSLCTLLKDMPVLDFLHSDIQGAEENVFKAAIETVNRRVRRICVGTHGRAIEATLLDLLVAHNWVLEFEQPCKVVQDGTKVANVADGVQVWRNLRAL